MLSKLIGKSAERKSAEKKRAFTPPTTLDISRVIRLPVAEPSDAAGVPEAESELTDMAVAGQRAEDAVESISEQFEAWMKRDLEKLVLADRAARLPDASPEAYRDLFTVAHNLRGAANSFGYPAISRLCGSLCTLLMSTRPGQHEALISLHVQACQAVYKSTQSGDPANDTTDEVADALEAHVALKVKSHSNPDV